jgi:hypothetical protein
MLEPSKELLADFKNIPTSLHTFSQGTPKEGVTAELIDVGSGTSSKSYKGKSVRGKMVLATGGAHTVHIEAVVKRGAAGVITDSMPYEFPRVRQSIDLPDAHAYQGIWPNSDFADRVTFGFSLTKRQGDELRGFLGSGKKVLLNAKVDAKIIHGKYEIVTATIKGSSKPEEEIFLSAHLCHPKPGANDNASGSGLLMEIARTLMALIHSGKISRPMRTIRFFWVPETTGTVALLSTHEEMKNRLVAGINLDMVGEDQTQCDSTLHMSATPDSLPSYLGDLVFSTLEASSKELDPFVKIGLASKFRFVRSTFSPGSDHAEFVASSVGIPCVSFAQWPDRFYHTSKDTIDRVSEDSLKRVGWTTAVSLLTLANADSRTAHELAILTYARGHARIAEAARRASEELFRAVRDQDTRDKGEELARLRSLHGARIEHITLRERKAVRSVLTLARGKELLTVVDSLAHHLMDTGEKSMDLMETVIVDVSRSENIVVPASSKRTKAEKEMSKLVPVRLFKGTIPWSDVLEMLNEERRSVYRGIDERDIDFLSKVAETANLIDGRRSAFDIAMALKGEYGETEPGDILTLLRDLKHLDLVSF